MDEPAGDLSPILTAHLFALIESRLIELLHSLSAEEWQTQTVSQRWKVKDVAAHLLDTQLRKLSLIRDGCAPELPAAGPPFDLAALNQEGVVVYGRLSPPVLIELMNWLRAGAPNFTGRLIPSRRRRSP
jgi:hypothetical protein